MTAVSGKAISRIRVRLLPDRDPDLSHLGEYSNTPDAVHIDRKERGDMERGTYRYFNLGTGEAEYIEADYSRMEAYNRGDWAMVGVIAEATIEVNGRDQTITTAGLWGVESDSGREYFREVGRDEVHRLCRDLAQLGFSARAVRRAVAEMRERGDDDGSD